jgi:hypothetical protein
MSELAHTLSDLAQKINHHHIEAERAAKSAVEHAIQAGNYLLIAKAQVKHGEWLPWLEANCEVSERTAQAYMRIARELPKLDEGKAQRVADLSLRDAMALLAEPKRGAWLSEVVEDEGPAAFWLTVDTVLKEIDEVNRQIWATYDILCDRDDLIQWIHEGTVLLHKQRHIIDGFLLTLGGTVSEGLEELECRSKALRARLEKEGIKREPMERASLFASLGLSIPFDPAIRPPIGILEKAMQKQLAQCKAYLQSNDHQMAMHASERLQHMLATIRPGEHSDADLEGYKNGALEVYEEATARIESQAP